MNTRVRHLLRAALPAAVLVGFTSSSPGAIVGGIGQRASSAYTPDGRLPVHTVNGAGLVGNAHSTNPAGTMWLTAGGDAAGHIEFDLGAVYSLSSLRVWNYNEATAGLSTRGIATANIDVATSPGAYSTHLAGQALAKAPGTETDFSESIAMGGVNARFVRLDVLTNHGDASFTGLSEIQFDGNLVSGNKAVPATVASVSSTIAGFNRLPEYTVNNSGVFSRSHSVIPDGNMWLAGNGDLTPTITYDLGSSQPISHMLLWNYNEFLTGRDDLLNRGVQQADFLISDDGLTFTPLALDVAIARAPGDDTTEYAQTIDFGGAQARFVQIAVDSNYGDAGFTGLSEVQFYAVPEPASFILLTSGLASLLIFRRRH